VTPADAPDWRRHLELILDGVRGPAGPP
jgi:hypothetical protein